MTRLACIHFERTKGKRCEQGVDVEQLRDGELRLPCVSIRGVSGEVSCDLRELPPEPSAAGAATGPMSKLLALALADLCTYCGEPITSTFETGIGGQVRALPCRHTQRAAQSSRNP